MSIQTSKCKSYDSWGIVTDHNREKMIERCSTYKAPLLELATLVRDLIYAYNSNHAKVIHVYINDGTLLGAYRDAKMIAHDYDFDFALYGTGDDLFTLYDFLKLELTTFNIHNNKQYSIKCFGLDHYAQKISIRDLKYGSYEHQHDEWYHVEMDIQLLADEDGKVVPQYFRDGVNKKLVQTADVILPLSSIKFEGYTFPCPNNVKKYLENNYGCIEKGALYDSDTCKYVLSNDNNS